MNNLILESIANREIILFDYKDGKERMVIPCCYGLINGVPQIHGIKFFEESSSLNSPLRWIKDNFRFYELDGMKNIRLFGLNAGSSEIKYTAHSNFGKIFAIIKRL